MSMATKLGNLMTYLVGLHSDSHAIFNYTTLLDHFGKQKIYISTITIPFVRKLDSVMKNNDFPLIKLHDPWIT